MRKIIICKICSKEVSKRSTLYIDGNRICRDHEESKKFLADQQAKREIDRIKKDIMAKLEDEWKESTSTTLRNIKAINPIQYRMMIGIIRKNHGWERANEIEALVDKAKVDVLSAIDFLADRLLKSMCGKPRSTGLP